MRDIRRELSTSRLPFWFCPGGSGFKQGKRKRRISEREALLEESCDVQYAVCEAPQEGSRVVLELEGPKEHRQGRQDGPKSKF